MPIIYESCCLVWVAITARVPQRCFFGPLPFAVHSGRKVNTRPVLTYPNTKSKCNGFYNGFHCSNGCWYMYSQSKSNTLLHDSFVPSTLGPRLHSLNYSIAPAPHCKEYFGRTGVCMYNVCIVKAQVSKNSHALASYVFVLLPENWKAEYAATTTRATSSQFPTL